MADEPKQEQQVEPVQAPEEVQLTEKQQMLALFREHVQPVLIGLAIALAAVLGYGAYKNYKQSTAMRASQMLMSSRSAEQLQQVINQYPSTPSAPIAMLTLAAEQFRAGQYDLAQLTYGQFKQQFPQHPMAAAADLGKAQCLEASGQIDQALAAYEAFAAANPAHFLTASAIFGKGRCLAQMGRYADAKAVYEDYVAANPESGWVPLADSAMLFVDKELRAQQKKKGVAAQKEPVSPEVFGTSEASAPLNLKPLFPSKEGDAR